VATHKHGVTDKTRTEAVEMRTLRPLDVYKRLEGKK